MLSRHDFSSDVFKQASREYNLEQVQRSRHLFNRHTGKLRYDWAELAGAHAPTLSFLRGAGVLGANTRFVGLELDSMVFDALCEEFGVESPDHTFVSAKMEYWVRGRQSDNVGVLNWDTWHLGSGDTFRRGLGELWEFADRQRVRLQGFALIINAGCDRGVGVENFVDALAELGHRVNEKHLTLPGVLYRSDDRKSHRINYCVQFGF